MGTGDEQHASRIRALDAQWLQAAGRRDLDGMMAIYASDARELLPDLPPIIGKPAIRAFHARLMTQLPRFAPHLELREIAVAEAGDLAVVQGTYRFTPPTQHPAQVQGGKLLGVWRQLGG